MAPRFSNKHTHSPKKTTFKPRSWLELTPRSPAYPTSTRHCLIPEMMSLEACHMHFEQLTAVTECWAGV